MRLDDAESSKKIDVAQGLRHECVLAPLLFNTVFMVVLRAAGKFFPADAAIMDNNMVQLQRKNKKGEKKGTQHTRKVDGRGWGEKEKVQRLWGMPYAEMMQALYRDHQEGWRG